MRRIFQIIICGFLFAIFGILCLFGNIIFCFFIIFGLQKFRFFINLSRDIVFWAWRFFIFIVKIFKFMEIEKDIDFIPKNQSIIISNHPSLIDVVLIISRIRRINCVVKKELKNNIFLYPAIKCCNYILNTQNEALLESAKMALERGETLLIFPEGTRTKNNIIFHKAAFYLAINYAKYLLIIFIEMPIKSLQKNSKWFKTEKMIFKLFIVGEINLLHFKANLANPLRVRALHKKISNIYREVNL